MNEIISDIEITGRVSYINDQYNMHKFILAVNLKNELLDMGYCIKENTIQIIQDNYKINIYKTIIIKDLDKRKKHKKLSRENKFKIFSSRVDTVIHLCKFKSLFNKKEKLINRIIIYLNYNNYNKKIKLDINEIINFSKYLRLNIYMDNKLKLLIFFYDEKF